MGEPCGEAGLKQDNAEIEAEIRGMGEKLDRVLETLLAAQSRVEVNHPIAA